MKQREKIFLISFFVLIFSSSAHSFYQMPWEQEETSSLGLWGTVSFFWWTAKQVFKLKNFFGGSSLIYTLVPGYVLASLFLSNMNNQKKPTLYQHRPSLFASKWNRKQYAQTLQAQLQPVQIGLAMLGAYGLYKLVNS